MNREDAVHLHMEHEAPQFTDTVALYCLNLGREFSQRGRWREAAACYRQLVLLEPKSLPAWYKFANALHLQGELEEAARAYQQALRLAPHTAELYYNLGVTRMRQGAVREALEAYSQAIRLRPQYAEAHNNLGTLLHSLGQIQAAATCFRAALRAKPDYHEARYNLALALQEQEENWTQLEEALEQHRLVIGALPDSASAHNNLGNTLLALGRPQQALESFERAVRLDPEHAEANWNLSLTHLLLGRFEEGWQRYDWRFRQPNMAPREFPQPLWDGSPFPSETVLIHAEQGLGDTIQFVRYLELVKERGGTVIFECQPPLVALLGCVRGADLLVPRGRPLPEFDYHAPLLSLPRIFHTALRSIPARVPYLSVDPERIESWKKRIGHGGRRKVGLVWSGSPANKINRRRSLPLSCLAPLATIPDLSLFSLQCGPQAEELKSAPKELEIVNLQDGATDVVDTAAMLMNLDLLISTDTMPPHLAGALGRPVWTLLAAGADWRWLTGRSDCPWYPTMRLFRQRRPGEWGPVIEEVRRALKATV